MKFKYGLNDISLGAEDRDASKNSCKLLLYNFFSRVMMIIEMMMTMRDCAAKTKVAFIGYLI